MEYFAIPAHANSPLAKLIGGTLVCGVPDDMFGVSVIRAIADQTEHCWQRENGEDEAAFLAAVLAEAAALGAAAVKVEGRLSTRLAGPRAAAVDALNARPRTDTAPPASPRQTAPCGPADGPRQEV